MAKEKILIVEDEIKISRFIQLELEHEGYAVSQCYDGREGLDKALNDQFDLIILDIMLPSLNGMEVLRRIRQAIDTPVIILTAKDEVIDKVMGLDIGADDYMTKPFAIEELLARIRVVFKRKVTSYCNEKNAFELGNLKLNLDEHTASFKNGVIDLTKKEFDLLKYFIENKNIVLTRDKILEKVWGYDYIGDTNIVDVYVRYLRSKIDDKYECKYIYTVRGVGYILKYDEESC